MPPREHNNMFPLEIYSSLRGLNSIQSLWSEGHQVYTYTNTIYLCSLWNVPPENADHCNYNTTIIFNKWLEDLFNPYWAGRTYIALPGKGWEGYIYVPLLWCHVGIIMTSFRASCTWWCKTYYSFVVRVPWALELWWIMRRMGYYDS